MTLKMLVKILLNLSFKQILSDVLETNHYPKNSKQSIMTRNVTLKLKRNKNLRKMSMMRTDTTVNRKCTTPMITTRKTNTLEITTKNLMGIVIGELVR